MRRKKLKSNVLQGPCLISTAFPLLLVAQEQFAYLIGNHLTVDFSRAFSSGMRARNRIGIGIGRG